MEDLWFKSFVTLNAVCVAVLIVLGPATEYLSPGRAAELLLYLIVELLLGAVVFLVWARP